MFVFIGWEAFSSSFHFLPSISIDWYTPPCHMHSLFSSLPLLSQTIRYFPLFPPFPSLPSSLYFLMLRWMPIYFQSLIKSFSLSLFIFFFFLFRREMPFIFFLFYFHWGFSLSLIEWMEEEMWDEDELSFSHDDAFHLSSRHSHCHLDGCLHAA